MPVKRLNYFHYQFLQENDFIDEQKYHKTMRQKHNKELHTLGRVYGLEVTIDTDTTKVKISSGMAVDGSGQEIIVENDVLLSVAGQAGSTAYLAIKSNDENSDNSTQTGYINVPTRITESYELKFRTDVDTLGLELTLAKITVDNAGNVTSIATDEREEAGAKVGDATAVSLKLEVAGHAEADYPAISGKAKSPAGSGLQIIQVNASTTEMTGALSVAGNIAVTGTVDGRDVSVDGSKLDTHSHNGSNSVKISPANLDSVSLNVTAQNLNTLTGGSASDASSLHQHSTIPTQQRTYYIPLLPVRVAAQTEFFITGAMLTAAASASPTPLTEGIIPLYLPQGAQLTEMGISIGSNNSTVDVAVIIKQATYGTNQLNSRVTLSASQAGTPNPVQTVKTITPAVVVDNNSGAYILHVKIVSYSSASIDIKGIYIKYDLAKLY